MQKINSWLRSTHLPWILKNPQGLVILACVTVAVPLIYVAIHSTANTQSDVIEQQAAQDRIFQHNRALVIERVERPICIPAPGSCAGCHYFIPDSPPGCSGAKPNMQTPHAQMSNIGTKPGDVWRAHRGASPLPEPISHKWGFVSDHTVTTITVQGGGPGDQGSMDLPGFNPKPEPIVQDRRLIRYATAEGGQ